MNDTMEVDVEIKNMETANKNLETISKKLEVTDKTMKGIMNDSHQQSMEELINDSNQIIGTMKENNFKNMEPLS